MSHQTPRCAVCDRAQPVEEQWELFVEHPDGGRQSICSTACLVAWVRGESEEPSE